MRQVKCLSEMHRAFHMLTLNYLFRLISTTCSNSNNPSAPQEPTTLLVLPLFHYPHPSFSLDQGMGNHQEFSLCAHPQFSWSSLKSPYSQSRGDDVAAWESQFWRPPVQHPSLGVWGDLLLRAHRWVSLWALSSANGNHFSKARPHPWDSPHSDRSLSRYESQAPLAAFGTILPVLWQ